MTTVSLNPTVKLICLLILLTLLTWSCDSGDEVQLQTVPPTLSEVDVSSVSKFTANVTSVIAPGNIKIEEKGFCYNTSGEPTIDDDKVIIEEEVTIMAAMLSKLSELTTYYIRAFAKTSDGEIIYSNKQSTFTTTFYQVPVAVVNSVKPFGSYIEVESLVISDNTSPILRRGVLISPNNDRHNNDVQEFFDVENGKGTFTISLSGLESETSYWIWAFVETELEGRAYAYSPVHTSTVSSIWIKGQSTTNISGSNYTLTGSHRIHLDVQVSDTGDSDATISEAGLIWSKDSGVNLDAPNIGKRVDARIIDLETYEIVAAPLEAGTKYYFRPYMINSKGTLIYGAEKFFTTRSAESPLFENVFRFTMGNTGVSSPLWNGVTYLLQSTSMTAFQKTDPVVGADRLIEAFENDGGIAKISFVFAKPGADSTVTSIVEHVANSGDRGMFAWKLTYSESTSVLILSNMIYKPENFPNLPTTPLDRRNHAKKLMDDPDTGAALTAYFEWIAGTTGPRRVLLDWFTDSHKANGSNPFILMPLDEDVNGELNYFRVGRIRWGTGAIGNVSLPVWN